MSFNNSRGETFLYELARDGDTTELIGYLKRGSSSVVRQRAAELLGDFSDFPDEQRRDEIIQELLTAVETADDEEVRAQAVDSLVRYGDDALKRLIDRFAEFDAASAPPWVIADNLVEWFDDDRPEFRLVAATGLGWFGDEGALPALVRAFTDPDPRVRLRAVRSCGSIGDDRCVEALARRLTDPDTRVQTEAASALGAIGSEKALDALIPAARNADPEVRQIAIDELGQYGSLAPLVVLLRALTDASGPIRRTAIVSLIELFVHAPPEESHEMRSTVAEQLETMDPDDVVTQLVDIMNESDRWAIRRNAVWLLGRLVAEADPPVQECLIDALDDEDGTTAQVAATTLARLGGDDLEKRLLLFMQGHEEESAAFHRAQFVLDQIGSDPSAELITTGVNYTYVSDPEDYPRPDRDADQ
jgi:HEAT repeat protein